jgi:hypothetical protein
VIGDWDAAKICLWRECWFFEENHHNQSLQTLFFVQLKKVAWTDWLRQ